MSSLDPDFNPDTVGLSSPPSQLVTVALSEHAYIQPHNFLPRLTRLHDEDLRLDGAQAPHPEFWSFPPPTLVFLSSESIF